MGPAGDRGAVVTGGGAVSRKMRLFHFTRFSALASRGSIWRDGILPGADGHVWLTEMADHIHVSDGAVADCLLEGAAILARSKVLSAASPCRASDARTKKNLSLRIGWGAK
jgi:hypothetical protein